MAGLQRPSKTVRMETARGLQPLKGYHSNMFESHLPTLNVVRHSLLALIRMVPNDVPPEKDDAVIRYITNLDDALREVDEAIETLESLN